MEQKKALTREGVGRGIEQGMSELSFCIGKKYQKTIFFNRIILLTHRFQVPFLAFSKLEIISVEMLLLCCFFLLPLSTWLLIQWQDFSIIQYNPCHMISSVQSLSCVRLFVTPQTVSFQASLSITNSQSLLRLTCLKSVMPSNHLSTLSPPDFNLSQHQGLFQ